MNRSKLAVVRIAEAQNLFDSSGLSPSTLSIIWSMADLGGDGELDFEEFVLVMHMLTLCSKGGIALPNRLPLGMLPILSHERRKEEAVGFLENCVLRARRNLKRVELEEGIDMSYVNRMLEVSNVAEGSDPKKRTAEVHVGDRGGGLQADEAPATDISSTGSSLGSTQPPANSLEYDERDASDRDGGDRSARDSALTDKSAQEGGTSNQGDGRNLVKAPQPMALGLQSLQPAQLKATSSVVDGEATPGSRLSIGDRESAVKAAKARLSKSEK